MNHLKQSTLFVALCLVGLTPISFATEPEQCAATIHFTNTDSAKWMVYNAHLGLAAINKKTRKLRHVTLKALDGANTPTDRYYLDLKFQLNKPKIQHEISTQRLWLSALNNNHVIIEINNQKQGVLTFDLSTITVLTLGIADDNLSTMENAKTALNHIDAAILTIDTLLPANTEDSTLRQFKRGGELKDGEADNRLLISTDQGGRELLASLTDLHHRLSIEFLGQLKTLAQAAISSGDLDNLNETFQQQKRELQFMLEIGQPIGNITLFNNNQLTFKDHGTTYHYVFPKLDLDIMNIQNDSILDFADTTAALAHLDQAVDWMRNWTVFGNTPYETSLTTTKN